MIESADIPPNQDPHNPDFHHVLLTFETTEWMDPPMLVSNDNALIVRKQTNDEIYRSMHPATDWHRYTQLGYYAVEDGNDFDIEWKAMSVDPLRIHRLIWYNYLYHIDREMDIPPKLHAWAMSVSRPYILEQQISSLLLNTDIAWKDQVFQNSDVHMEDVLTEENTEEGEWSEVPPPRGKKRQDQKNRLQAVDQDLGLHPAPANTLQADTTPLDSPTIANQTPAVTPSPTLAKNLSKQYDDSKSQQNEAQTVNTDPRAPHSNVATNDGTHRISIRWEPPDSVETYEYDKGKLQASLSNILKALFTTEDGKLYRWESEDLLHTKDIQTMNPVEIRDYISPTITFIPSRSQIVFGIRYGFAINPVNWIKTPTTKATMTAQHISLNMSNSKSTSGTLVTAGFILLKAPNTTHRHRYTQYLLSQLPDATPFFDVERQSRAPNNQTLPHLVIKCGEKHVTPVCQAMVTLLTGRGNALFLPRYAFSTMTADQVEKQFDFHLTWSKSLVEIPLSPIVTHLDQERTEYYDDGTTVRRSTR